MYGYQGQYVINPSYQGLSPYGSQTAGNVLAMITALIAAGLYGNIGIKVIYNAIFVEFFTAPPINSKGGKIIYAAFVPIYWSLAFIIAAAIPNFSGLTAIVSATCILQFTYSFPPILYIGWLLQTRAMELGESFNPRVNQTIKNSRFYMKAMVKDWYHHLWLWVYFLGALVTAGLGSYSAIETLITAFKDPQVTAFTCHSPLDG